HDKTLKRMCGADRKIHECTYEELASYSLAGTQERIPLFMDVLKMVGGRVPLIVEIKEHGNWKLTTQAAAKHLDWYEERYGYKERYGYEKPLFCVESFHPGVVAWFRAHRRHYLRGQLSSDYMREKVNSKWSSRFIVSNLLLNWAGRPDFIAYNCLYADQFTYKLIRHLFRTEYVAWTVKSQKQLESLRRIYQIYIFEGFIPEY
ncbi:MAG: glycerophosphodiester phosphodiesterase, partial [Lachnospiraceae bacterium]|nr:glycerophosphodiester phosphodiesterase [Lachnospiraceae bacterium]